MEAIVLAGGFGTRLRQIVSNVPKPMAPIAGRPFLEILLGSLARKGFRRVIFSLGFMAKNITEHFGASFGELELSYVTEDYPLGTGGAIRLAMLACKQDHVFVFNGDTYLDLEVDLVELKWQLNQRPIVVARQVPETSRYGRLVVNDLQISSFSEKGMVGPGLINAGCYVLPINALDMFPIKQPFSIETDYFVSQVQSTVIEVFVTQGAFIDIGIPEDYSKAQALLMDV